VNEICRQAIERFAAEGADGAHFLRELNAVAARGRCRAAGYGTALPRRDEVMDEAVAERLTTLFSGRR
jgi:hypothetical protein